MRGQALFVGDRRDGSGQTGGRGGIELDDPDALDEVAHRQALAEAGRAARRQDMVGARRVIAEGGGGVRPDEHRPRVAHERHELRGIGYVQFEVLGSEGVRQRQSRRPVVAGDDRDALRDEAQLTGTLGPASPSMRTSPMTWRLASVT